MRSFLLLLFKFDCIMSTFEAKTELTDFSFVKLCRQAEFHSLTAGGVYERAVIRGEKMQSKLLSSQFPSEIYSYKPPPQYLYFLSNKQ